MGRLFYLAERQGFLLRKRFAITDPSRVLISVFLRKRATLRLLFIAERQGFEPWVPARAQRFSRPPRSSTPASFQWCKGSKFFYYWCGLVGLFYEFTQEPVKSVIKVKCYAGMRARGLHTGAFYCSEPSESFFHWHVLEFPNAVAHV